MIIGDCSIDESDRWGTRSLESIVFSALGDRDIPVIFAPVFGHANLVNPLWPIGCRVELDCAAAKVTLLETPLDA